MLDDRVMYVGQTSHLFVRLKRHRVKGIDYDSVRIMWTPRHELRAVEARLIQHFRPPWNTVIPTWRPERLEPDVPEVVVVIDCRAMAKATRTTIGRRGL
jgi:hypothetical protein